MLKSLLFLASFYFAIGDRTLSFDPSKFNLNKCSKVATVMTTDTSETRYIFMFKDSATQAEKNQFAKDLLCSGGFNIVDLSIINGFSATTSQAFIEASILKLNAPHADIIDEFERDKKITLDPIEGGNFGAMGLDF